MKLLTQIKIDGTPIPVPDSVKHTLVNPGTFGENILRNSIYVIFVISVVYALFMLIWAGIQWMMSEGDKEKVAKARARIIYSLIGLIVMFLGFFIISFIGGAFGVELLKRQ